MCVVPSKIIEIRKIQNNESKKNEKGRKIWVFIDLLLPELHSIMKIVLEKNCHEYPPITQESNGCWGLDVDQKAIKYKKKDFMNCAETYDYVVDELLARCIYTLGKQEKYNNLLRAGWKDCQEITQPLNVTEITELVAKKKRREDVIFEDKKQIIKVQDGPCVRSYEYVDGTQTWTSSWPTKDVEAIPVKEIATMECTEC